jgi:succinate dehydrogenase / fumarate reductase cytochrome b subunit
MRQLSTLYQTSIGAKAAMAASGLVLSGWVALHMAGNLLVFGGPELINTYGGALQGSPLLWLQRLVLGGAIGAHLLGAWAVVRQSRRARGRGYAGALRRRSSTAAGRSMRISAVMVLLFLAYHPLHIYGALHGDYRPGDIYHSVVAGFADPLVAALYTAATALFGLHLYHGVWSTLRSLGLADLPKVCRLDRWARGFAAVVTLGFLAPVIAAQAGLLTL